MPGTHVVGLGLEGRFWFHFGPKAKDLGGDSAVDMAYQSRLWIVIALFVGHKAFGDEGPKEAVVFSTAAACAAWIYLRSSVEELASSEFPRACKGPMSKIEFHATFRYVPAFLDHREAVPAQVTVHLLDIFRDPHALCSHAICNRGEPVCKVLWIFSRKCPSKA